MAYFSNGTEGAVLDAQCNACPLGDEPCPVYGVQSIYNYDQVEPGQEKLREALNVLVADNGLCQVRALLESKGKCDG